MRLVDTLSGGLVEFVGGSVPPYAILSHTWEHEEVTYQELAMLGPEVTSKKGYTKIMRACEQAVRDSISHIWIDTCCIDKRSSAELTQALNSMFQWYQSATKCYVHLSDLTSDSDISDALPHCRWFTRGWTLQELLAPKVVDFYDQLWEYRGSKSDFVDLIANSTGIDRGLLDGSSSVNDYSVAVKMSWAANRETLLVEDMAYCLLGILDVNMALLYGEGPKAFRRLQEEIIKRNNDMTIFAWDHNSEISKAGCSMLAPSVSSFPRHISVKPFASDVFDFVSTNKGMYFSGETTVRVISTESRGHGRKQIRYLILLGSAGKTPKSWGGICLRRIGPQTFCRDGAYPLVGFGLNEIEISDVLSVDNLYILTDLAHRHDELEQFYRTQTIRIPHDETWSLKAVNPSKLWDYTDRLFLNHKPSTRGRYSVLLFAHFAATIGGTKVEIGAICEISENVPRVNLFRVDEDASHTMSYIFETRARYDGATWHDLKVNGIKLPEMGPQLTLRTREQTVKITAFTEGSRTRFDCCTAFVYTLQLSSATARI